MAENGNIAALRAALELAVDYSEYIVDHLPDEFAGEIHAASEILEKCDAALAAPPRNCDVGNAADQARRFQDFCHAHRTASTSCMRTCPGHNAPDVRRCQAIWSQLPYEKGGAE